MARVVVQPSAPQRLCQKASRRTACPKTTTKCCAGESTEEPASRLARGVVILPGLGNASGDYDGFVKELESRGLTVEVASVKRIDWLRNAAGLRDWNYWKGTLSPRPTVDWFLDRVEASVDSLKRQLDGAPITLLAHSAGGWLGRIYLRDFERIGIDKLITLGSPHLPPPEGGEGVVDQTRGILTYCQNECPGAFHDDIKYITVAGKYIKGARIGGEGTVKQKLVGLGYQQVCGDAEVWGDGVVPVPAAHLEGALNLDLDGIYHSPVGAVHSDNEKEEGEKKRVWYGSESVLEQWVGHLVDGAEVLA